jgi:hypothetical protein
MWKRSVVVRQPTIVQSFGSFTYSGCYPSAYTLFFFVKKRTRDA